MNANRTEQETLDRLNSAQEAIFALFNEMKATPKEIRHILAGASINMALNLGTDALTYFGDLYVTAKGIEQDGQPVAPKFPQKSGDSMIDALKDMLDLMAGPEGDQCNNLECPIHNPWNTHVAGVHKAPEGKVTVKLKAGVQTTDDATNFVWADLDGDDAEIVAWRRA